MGYSTPVNKILNKRDLLHKVYTLKISQINSIYPLIIKIDGVLTLVIIKKIIEKNKKILSKCC